MLLSHSEAETWNLCQRRHYYAFGERLQSRNMSVSLTRGNYGHSFMETFFTSYMQNYNWGQAILAVRTKYELAMVAEISNPERCKMLTDLLARVLGYLETYRLRIESWAIIGVEQEFRLELHEDVTYPFKVDLIIREKGQVKIIDWKFTYDFYDPDVLNLLPQIPKYVGALRAMGYWVDAGYYGFIRYRSLKEPDPKNLYQLHPVPMSKHRIMEAFQDYAETIDEVAAVKNMPLDAWSKKVRRVANNMICKSCSFKFLCQVEHNGSDAKLIRQQDFEPNTYGYKEDSDA